MFLENNRDNEMNSDVIKGIFFNKYIMIVMLFNFLETTASVTLGGNHYKG